jgi:replicative DNA helicase
VLDRILPDAESRRNVDGPYLHTLMEACPHPSRAAVYGRMVLEASIHRRTADRAVHLGYGAQVDAPADVVFDQLGKETQQWLSELEALAQRWAAAGGEPASDLAPEVRLGPATRQDQASDEVALVASLVAAPWQYAQIQPWLEPMDFTRTDMRAIYLAIADLHVQGQPTAEVTITWAALRRNPGSIGLDGDCLNRLREAGIPGYAPVAARQVLNASLLRATSETVARVHAVSRMPQVRPADFIKTSTSLIGAVRSQQLRGNLDARTRWSALGSW